MGGPDEKEGLSRANPLLALDAALLLLEAPGSAIWTWPEVIGPAWEDAVARETGGVRRHPGRRKDLRGEGLGLHRGGTQGEDGAQEVGRDVAERLGEVRPKVVQLLLDILEPCLHVKGALHGFVADPWVGSIHLGVTWATSGLTRLGKNGLRQPCKRGGSLHRDATRG